MKSEKKPESKNSLALLSGVFIGTSYIPFPPWAVFFCYVPLWLFALKAKNLRHLIVGGFLCSSVVTLIGFNWVFYAVGEMGLSFWQAFLVFFIFVLICNLHIPLSLALWWFFQKFKNSARGLSAKLLLPVLLGLCTAYYPMIFKWHLGYTFFYAKWPIFQTAEIWGFKFLNTFILFSNLVFLHIYLHLRQSLNVKAGLKLTKFFIFNAFKKFLKPASYAFSLKLFFLYLAFFALLNLYGKYLENRLPPATHKINVLMVQPSIENYQQDNKTYNSVILSKVLQETSKHLYPAKRAKNKADLILWPEGAYPYPVNYLHAQKNQDPVQKWVRIFGLPLIISAEGEHSLPVKKSEKGYTNSVFVFDKNGALSQPPYNKIKLLPFGEYMPGVLAFLNEWRFGEDRAFRKGTGHHKTLGLKLVPLNLDKTLSKAQERVATLGFQVCYEGLFDNITRDTVREGADLLINVSNDTWFGKWQEPYQHLYMTLSRAVEARRPMVRGANSGFSAVVSAKGKISGPLEFGKQSQIKEVFLYSKAHKVNTFFMSYGYYINQIFLWLCFILSFLPLSPLKRAVKL